MGRDLMRNL